jgi:nickel transport protein
VEAKLKGDRVAVEAFFDDDTPAADAKVAVTTEDGRMIAEGKADAKGMWSFLAPPAGKYKVTVNAGGGHVAKTTITIPTRPAAMPTPPTPDDTAPVSGAEPEMVVSDGPTRAETTGWQRWLMAVVGVALIGLFTWGVRLAARRKAHREAREATR